MWPTLPVGRPPKHLSSPTSTHVLPSPGPASLGVSVSVHVRHRTNVIHACDTRMRCRGPCRRRCPATSGLVRLRTAGSKARRLRLDHGPATTTKLDREMFRSNVAQHLFPGVPPPRWDLGRHRWIRLGVTELLQEHVGLGSSELPRSLALRESHRTACVPKIAMAGFLQKGQQLLDLPCRRRWSLLLPECHVTQSYRSVRHNRPIAGT